jgi:hypothetical protein
MKKTIPAILITLAIASWGCEENDLGRYCVVGQRVPSFENTNTVGQPSVTILNIEAPECNDRICLQQGPFQLHPDGIGCTNTECQPPWTCGTGSYDGDCVYNVRAFCTKECTKHKNCKEGPQSANGDQCTKYVCHKQAPGDPFEGHCICVCKDFLINPDEDPPAFYRAEDIVPEPSGCQ